MPKCKNKLDLSNRHAMILQIYYHLYFTLPHFYTFIEFLMLNRVLQCLTLEDDIMLYTIMKRKLTFCLLRKQTMTSDIWIDAPFGQVSLKSGISMALSRKPFFTMTFCIWWFHDNLQIIGKPSVIVVNRWHLQNGVVFSFGHLILNQTI